MKKLNKFFLENPETFRKVVLNDFQIEIFNAVVKQQPICTVRKMLKVINVKQCTLNNHLKALCEKGYLTRKMIRDRVNTGEYYYSINNKD